MSRWIEDALAFIATIAFCGTVVLLMIIVSV